MKTESEQAELEPVKQCGFCAISFTPRTTHHRFCSASCRKSAFTGGERRGVHRLTSAAISQALVTTDLMWRGYGVYKAQSTAYPADLVAISDEGSTLRIKVKTVRRRADGSINLPSRQPGVDVLALVIDGEIHYEPRGRLLSSSR